MAEELVLAFPRRILDEIGDFQGIEFNIASYIPAILDKQLADSCLGQSRRAIQPSNKSFLTC